MKRFVTAVLLGSCAIGTASAQGPQSPVGEWLVQDGTAHIRVVSCGGAMWGVINWTKGPPGRDDNNPNPALRARSVMGMPILINMQPSDNEWEGEVYNADNGKTYSSTISLKSPDILEIKGCVFGGLLCGGEDWKRVPVTKGSPPDQLVCSGLVR